MKLKLQFIFSMLMFGSIGIVIKHISMDSAAIVQWRTIIATVFLLLLFAVRRKRPDFAAIKANWLPLLISGTVLGGNWAFLFEAFHRTSIGTATIIYYFAPILVFFLAPVFFKEHITKGQLLGIGAAISGTVLINIMSVQSGDFSIAILFALASAVLYATVMICNRFMHELSGLDSTFVQLFIAALVMTLYCTLTTGNILTFSSASDMLLITILGVVHTGMVFPMYFYAVQKLPPQTVSILSYLDPASALVFAFVFLGESLSWYQLVGAALIFGGALFAQKQKGRIQPEDVSV